MGNCAAMCKSQGRAFLQPRKPRATYTKTPMRIPADPAPAMALPTMRAGELIAVAQTMDPTSRIATADTKTHLTRHCS